MSNVVSHLTVIVIIIYSIHSLISYAGSSCPKGNVTVVSDVNNSSLQLVEICSSGRVWSPVCDNNWTRQDATVVCRELNNQGI